MKISLLKNTFLYLLFTGIFSPASTQSPEPSSLDSAEAYQKFSPEKNLIGTTLQDTIYKVAYFSDDCFNEKLRYIHFNRDIEMEYTGRLKGMIIAWPSALIGGDYELVINSRQIYLKTAVQGEDYCKLLWVEDVDPELFPALLKLLHANAIEGISVRKEHYRSYYREFVYSSAIDEGHYPLNSVAAEKTQYLENVKSIFLSNFKSLMKMIEDHTGQAIPYPGDTYFFQDWQPVLVYNFFGYRKK